MSRRLSFLRFIIFILYLFTPVLGSSKNNADDLALSILLEVKSSSKTAAQAASGDAGADQELCALTFTNLDAQTGSGTWSTLSPGVVIDDPNSPTTQVTSLNPGANVFTWTVGTVTDDVTITVYELPTVANAGSDQDLCGITSTQLDANVPLAGNGEWSISGGSGGNIDDPLDPKSQFSGLINESYTLTWTISNGICSFSSDNVVITFFSLPGTPALVSSPPVVCEGPTTFVLLSSQEEAPNGGTYQWFKDGALISNTSQDLSLFTAANTGSYEVALVDGNFPNCISARSNTVDVSIVSPPSQPTVIRSSNGPLCFGETVNFTSSEAPVNGNYIWFRNGVSFSNSRSIVVSEIGSNSYSVRVATDQGCISAESIPEVVTIEPLPTTPTLSSSGNTICADGSRVELTSNLVAPNGGSYIWLKDGAPISGQTSQRILLERANESGDYSVQTVNGTGARCASAPSGVQTVQIFQLPSVARVGSDQQLCDESSTVLVAETPVVGVGTWNTSSPGVTINDPNDPGSAATGLSPGAYTFSWQVNNGACIGTPVDMSVQVFAAPSAAIAEADKLVCDQVSTTISAAPPVSGTGEWTLMDGVGRIVNSSSPQTTVEDLLPGTEVTLAWTVRNGACVENSDELRIQVGESPAPALTEPSVQLCNQASTQLSAAAPAVGEGQWTLVSGSATLADATDPNTRVNDLVPGEDVTLRWTVTNQCGVNIQEVTLQNDVAPDVADAGPDVELCGITSINLAGSGQGGQWTIVSGDATILDEFNAQSAARDLSIGVNVLKYSIPGNTCEGTEDEVTITVFQEPSEAFAGDDLYVCNGETIASLNAQPPTTGTGRWTILSGDGTVQNDQEPSTQVTGLRPGQTILRWSVENGSCTTNTDDLVLNVFPSPGVTRDEVEICLGEQTQLEAVGGDRYQWQPAAGLSDPSLPGPLASPLETTLYTVDITNDNCVSRSVTVNVIVNPLPTLEVSGDTTIFANEEVELFASGASTYQWAPPTGLDDPTSSSPVASPMESTQYRVTGANEFECEATAEVLVDVSDNFEVFIPDLFSPNGDQMNDILYVNTLGISKFEFRIFDRTGREMFSTTNQEEGWDGTFNGVEQGMDSYVYYVQAETVSGNRIRRKGSIQLVR